MRGKRVFWRTLFYVGGLILLALGVTLNTKTDLGVSPIISMPFSIANIWKLDFGVTTFAVYSLFVVIQFLLKGKNREWRDLLQVPFAFAFSALLTLFEGLFDFAGSPLFVRILWMLAGILLTGAGAAMVVDMKLVPNPADGLAQAVGDALRRDMGFGKNVIDLISVGITVLLGLLFAHKLIGVGIGTIAAMIFTGRVVALFNRLCLDRMKRLAHPLP